MLLCNMNYGSSIYRLFLIKHTFPYPTIKWLKRAVSFNSMSNGGNSSAYLIRKFEHY